MIQVNNLCREFKVGSEVVMALNNVNLEIATGEFVALMGPSGSGKTTLLHILGALDEPTSGEVSINQQNLRDLNEKQKAVFRNRSIGFIFQFFYLQSYYNAVENIALPLMFNKTPYAKRLQRAQTLLNDVNLTDRGQHRPDELSGGERQRVAIARALIHEPKLLLADEPTGNLDRKNSDEIMNLLRRINQEKGTTILLVTHDEHVAACAGRVIKMNKGEIL